MDFENLDSADFNISARLNEQIPIEKWSLLKPKNDFNFGKKPKGTNEKNDRILEWLQPSVSQFTQKQRRNLPIKNQHPEIVISRPINTVRRPLLLQKAHPVKASESCFNLPKSFFSGAVLGITPQVMSKNNEITFTSAFAPQSTSTPLPCDNFFSADQLRNSTQKGSPNLTYKDFLSSIQPEIRESNKKLFNSNIAEDIRGRLKAAYKSENIIPKSSQELIQNKVAEVLSQKRAKLRFLKNGKNRKYPNSTFTFRLENDHQQNAEFSEQTNRFAQEKPMSPDFILSHFWLKESNDVPGPIVSPSLHMGNQFGEHWKQNNLFLKRNPKSNEILSNFAINFETPSFKDQSLNFNWQSVTFSSLLKEVPISVDFDETKPLFSNSECDIFNLLQMESNHTAHNKTVVPHLMLTEKRTPKDNLKRKSESQPEPEETNQNWKRRLLDESVQTNSSEILRSIDHLIKESPPYIKPRSFNIYQRAPWE